MPTTDTRAAIERVLAAKPGAEPRAGQLEMAEAVAAALAERRHLMVEAGTGTGKSLAYLIPAILSGRRVVVATATRTLQDQLAAVELPFLAEHLGVPVTWAVVKGRQAYACLAKLTERFGARLDTPGDGVLFPGVDFDVLRPVAEWAASHPTGDRDDLADAVGDEAWQEVSVSGMECPGAARCPQGDACFAEGALARARAVQVVVTNHHFYGLHLASGGKLLPPHEAVVFDEAHRLETALSSTFGVEISAARLRSFAGAAAPVIDPRARRGHDPLGELRDAAARLEQGFAALPEARLAEADGAGPLLSAAYSAVTAALRGTRKVDADDPLAALVARVEQQGGHVAGDLAMALEPPDGYVAWAEPARAVVRAAPVDVGDLLAGSLLVNIPAVFTSATLTVGAAFGPLAARLGLLEEAPAWDPLAEQVDDPVPRSYDRRRVPGSFDFAAQGLLYIASELPDPGDDDFVAAALDEISALTAASAGRALVLTTSHRMVRAVAERLAGAPFRLLVQGDLAKRRLMEEFSRDETSTLVATMGYWEGIDVPGPSLSLVVIDRLPFPRPDDPLLQARRESAAARGRNGFEAVDLPIATMLVAQGAGRLIRSRSDRGVVAVLDRRLRHRGYGRRILASMPRLLRTSDRVRAVRYLEALAG